MLRTGNMVCFRSPVDLPKTHLTEAKKIEDALVFAIEIPDVGLFGGVAFQRLFVAQVATYLNEHFHISTTVNRHKVYVNQTPITIAHINEAKNACLIHVIIDIPALLNSAHLALDRIGETEGKIILRNIEQGFYAHMSDMFITSMKVCY